MPGSQAREDPDADQLRAVARRARQALSDDARRHAQQQIVERLLARPELGAGARVGWYLATDGEVDLSGAVDELRGRGVALHLPMVGPDRTMVFGPWDHDTELAVNRYGIDEPARPRHRLAGADLDVVVAPCVAVDTDGHRLGFGAGYYDRALADSSGLVVGVAFETQVVARIRHEVWDVRLDLVLTEAREIVPHADDLD